MFVWLLKDVVVEWLRCPASSSDIVSPKSHLGLVYYFHLQEPIAYSPIRLERVSQVEHSCVLQMGYKYLLGLASEDLARNANGII